MSKDPKYLGIPNINFSLTKEDDKREKKFAKQRKRNGFDDSETWSLHDTIAKFTLPRLKRFREITIGCPVHYEHMEDWQKDLDKMITSFEHLTQENDNILWDNKKTKEIDEGLDLFRENFLWLWW